MAAELTLNKFDMKTIQPGSICAFVARRGGGKSTAMRELMYHKRHISFGICFSDTEGVNSAWSRHIPYSFIYGKYKQEILQKLLLEQKVKALESRVKHESRQLQGRPEPPPETFVIFEDCLHDSALTKDAVLRELFMNGRHYNITVIIAMQNPRQLVPQMRSMVDKIFVLAPPDAGYTQRLYEDWFSSVVPSFDLFQKMINFFTESYGMIVLDQKVQSNELTERIFWYRAADRGDFRVGCRQWWTYHLLRAKSQVDMLEEAKQELAKLSAATAGPTPEARGTRGSKAAVDQLLRDAGAGKRPSKRGYQAASKIRLKRKSAKRNKK